MPPRSLMEDHRDDAHASENLTVGSDQQSMAQVGLVGNCENAKGRAGAPQQQPQQHQPPHHDAIPLSVAVKRHDERELPPRQVSPSTSYHYASEEFHTEWDDTPLCGGIGLFPLCQGQLEHQLDVMTQCRHPMALLHIFDKNADSASVSSGDGGDYYAGAYQLPQHCEYCGSHSTDDCADDCERPRLYFQKKRPPFVKPSSNWDPRTDLEIPRPVTPPAEPSPQVQPKKSPSWVSGLFSRRR